MNSASFPQSKQTKEVDIMVFCYKIITESPRRASLSPRKKSPVASAYNVPSSVSLLIRSYDYETCTPDVLDSIPEKDWRLLAALARKREDTNEREKQAEHLRKLWQKEKVQREIVEAETLGQYKRYIIEKRRQEQSRHEHIQYQKSLESQLKRRELLNCIRHKEQRSAELLAYIDDKKTSILVDKALEEEARAQLAADRRVRIGKAEQFRKHEELIDTERRANNAIKRRNAILKEASQRVAVHNALNTWESLLLRQEASAIEASRRAHHAAHAALTTARGANILRARDASRRRARKLAVITEQLRDAIKWGR